MMNDDYVTHSCSGNEYICRRASSSLTKKKKKINLKICIK